MQTAISPFVWRAALAALCAVAPVWAASPVATAPVQWAQTQQPYALDGVLEAVRQATLEAQTSARVLSLRVQAGDRVQAGQLLATLDARAAASGVQQAQAQVQQADAALGNARAQWERTRDLQAQGFLSPAALDKAQAAYREAQAAQAATQAQAQQARLGQDYTRITAPFAGWVQQTWVQAGDLALPGKPLLQLYAPAPLRAVVQVPASRARTLQEVDTVQIGVGAGATTRWLLPRTRTLVPATDPQAQSSAWRLELSPQDSAGLLPGERVAVRLWPARAAAVRALQVPQAAVLQRGELTAVYVAAKDHFVLRAVRLGASVGADAVEVRAGLAAGEAVALDPVRAGLADAVPAQ